MDNLKRRHNATFTDTPYDPAFYNGGIQGTQPIPSDDLTQSDKLHKPPSFPVIPQYSSNKYLAYCQQHHEVIIPTVLTILSFWTRFRLISLSKTVVWDEAHFGKFGSHYLKHDFYFDVHPPLGKMLVGLSGVLAGYNGSFGFESGSTYPDGMHYGVMRIFNAMWGALLVPLAYLTARQLNLTVKASVLAATMVLLDTALLCISRFILLDSMLLFFTCTTLYCLSKFHNLKNESFSEDWYLWLFMTGLSLGCVLSVKWVGLFAVALVGIYTVEDLWDKLGDLQMPKHTYAKHWVSRIVCLIVLPLVIYIMCFALHFAILYKSGDGDAQMSSLFQANLEGSSLGQNPLELAYGSKLTIKNFGYGGGLLHSHIQKFPEGSKQQQVTCYHHKDDNNHWIIKTPRNAKEEDYEDENNIRYVKDGDIIRLVHASTGVNLHSHPVSAPITTGQWEVSGYGSETVGDGQDNWKVEVVGDISKGYDNNGVRSLTTRFRLRHVQQGCLLTANNVILPQWGFKQVEVHCDKRNRVDDPHTWWNVEEHYNDKLPPAPANAYKSHFFQDFWHLNVAMWTSNNALIPDPDKIDILSSEPAEWPLASVGLRMCGWDDNTIKFYLLGNPIVWWSSFLSVLVFATSTIFYIVRMQRKIYDLTNAQWDQYLYVGKTLFLGWFLHYIPFFIMGRVTYLHHYFPALYFSIFMGPFLMDHFTRTCSSRTQWIIFGVLYTSIILVFIYFSPLVYGMSGPVTAYSGRKWLNSWNLVD
ncbi:Dolichyl-phosphate-mannose-protein mannosyltransferase-domain-containing protein [Absidia repens]|uniref:Dolichyl-phosphate-mannose--protein mannosyltransferase n=1 Tax=Absidia repens TaxID=90262 RepID=A0A1X2IQ17_9FUNG|nr:Dolichyl-phosphate-mannose-protein mannosyltransferase-domain-containing protein [Absidia repens]